MTGGILTHPHSHLRRDFVGQIAKDVAGQQAPQGVVVEGHSAHGVHVAQTPHHLGWRGESNRRRQLRGLAMRRVKRQPAPHGLEDVRTDQAGERKVGPPATRRQWLTTVDSQQQ